MEDAATQEDDIPTQRVIDDASPLAGMPTIPPSWGRFISANPGLPPIYLRQNQVTLGRNRTCTVVFSDPRVSNTHCRVFRERASATFIDATPDSQEQQSEQKLVTKIEDLSSNGTWINQRKLGRLNQTVLRHGDLVQLVFIRQATGAVAPEISYVFHDMTLTAKYDYPADLRRVYDVKDQILGKGAFSEVYLGVKVSSGLLVAIKIIDKKKLSPGVQAKLRREAEILVKLSHPNIIRIYDIFETDRYLYLVLEYADGGELYEKIVKSNGGIRENQARRIFSQILEAFKYLHARGVIHRDIKPENILFSGSCVKVTDFGLARLANSKDKLQTLCGTPQYVAPEIASRVINSAVQDDTHVGYNKSVDMWSLGVLLYVMLSGQPPFQDQSFVDLNLYEQIELGLFDFSPSPEWNRVSEAAKSLVQGLMTVKTEDRLNAEQALAHPWIQAGKHERSNDEIFLLAGEEPVLVDEEEEEEDALGASVRKRDEALHGEPQTPEKEKEEEEEGSMGAEFFSPASLLGSDIVRNVIASPSDSFLGVGKRKDTKRNQQPISLTQPTTFLSRLSPDASPSSAQPTNISLTTTTSPPSTCSSTNPSPSTIITNFVSPTSPTVPSSLQHTTPSPPTMPREALRPVSTTNTTQQPQQRKASVVIVIDDSPQEVCRKRERAAPTPKAIDKENMQEQGEIVTNERKEKREGTTQEPPTKRARKVRAASGLRRTVSATPTTTNASQTSKPRYPSLIATRSNP